jgi:hypothetical protein
MAASRLILAGCVCALLAGCGAAQIKTNMPALKSWLEKDEKAQASSAHKRPPAASPVSPVSPVSPPAVPQPVLKTATPIPAKVPAKRKAVVKKTEAQATVAQPSVAEPPKPNPWAIAPQ